jgi:hypothetical protein
MKFRVVLTGPAHDVAGNAILRADLIYACTIAGIMVEQSMSALTNMLVASRVDTVKARKAAERGLAVMDYPSFLQHFGLSPVIQEASVAKPCPYADSHQLIIPDKWEDKL